MPRHIDNNEGEKTVLGRDTKISVGTAGVVFVTLFGALLWGRSQVEEVKGEVRKIWSIEDQQNFADSLRRNNPGVSVPDPYDIRRMRRAGDNPNSGKGPMAAIGNP